MAWYEEVQAKLRKAQALLGEARRELDFAPVEGEGQAEHKAELATYLMFACMNAGDAVKSLERLVS